MYYNVHHIIIIILYYLLGDFQKDSAVAATELLLCLRCCVQSFSTNSSFLLLLYIFIRHITFIIIIVVIVGYRCGHETKSKILNVHSNGKLHYFKFCNQFILKTGFMFSYHCTNYRMSTIRVVLFLDLIFFIMNNYCFCARAIGNY